LIFQELNKKPTTAWAIVGLENLFFGLEDILHVASALAPNGQAHHRAAVSDDVRFYHVLACHKQRGAM
jgi:hypothetical protein